VNAAPFHANADGYSGCMHPGRGAPAVLEARPLLTPPTLPRPRGPLSDWLIRSLRGGRPGRVPRPGRHDVEDVHLGLYVCYELHYRGFDGVAEELEWDPRILELRRALERCFVAHLVTATGPTLAALIPREAVARGLRSLASGTGGPSLSQHLLEHGTIAQFREFAIHRSAYQLKEADPHTWALPRLTGEAKANMATIQYDEYGSGSAAGIHSECFARTMRALDLDERYGAYVDRLPASSLATVNLISMFGLHRRWRGALTGHLALFEMTSVEPMRRYSAALARLGFGPEARDFFDVHVVADEAHRHLGLAMADALAAAEPELSRSIVWGAECLTALERRFSGHLLRSWADRRSSLLDR
jgi:hypothetical protein